MNRVAVKLKYHRLKPGGVLGGIDGAPLLAVKLKHHRLKRGGVLGGIDGVVASCKIEVPRAKARWCHVWIDKPQS